MTEREVGEEMFFPLMVRLTELSSCSAFSKTTITSQSMWNLSVYYEIDMKKRVTLFFSATKKKTITLVS